jgi:hypothetical protein
MSIASEKIRMSWLLSSSIPPRPSESTMMMLMGSFLSLKPDNGVPQTQMPLVHGLMVGPTPKPRYRLSSTRLSK